jgi:hypothetical protein
MVFGSLKDIAICKYYQTREEIIAAGYSPGEFDPNKPGKSWVLNPSNYTPDEDGFVTLTGIALAKDGRTPRVDINGNPYFANFKVPFEDLDKFNVPEKKIGQIPDQKVLREYQLPLRALFPDERLVFTMFGIPAVVKVKPAESNPGVPVTSNQEVLEKLDAIYDMIAAKFDLVLAVINKK